jgi:putative ABC transport system ATP-binding protein
MSSLLTATGISKRYGVVPVLQGIDLRIEAGESVAITGHSGCGKTTMLCVLAGLEPPDAGSVRFDNRDLYALKPAELGRLRGASMGIVFQEYHLVPSLTALENVSLPLEIQGDSEAMDKAASLLDRVGLTARIQHFPHQLSGGEQQRVAVARALAVSPRLIFADEPTGNLDETTAQGVEDLLFSLIHEQGIATVIVTHNADLAARCDRVLRLHGGRLA